VFLLLAGLRHSAGQLGTERCVVVHPGMRVTHTQGARQTHAHSHPVGQMQCVKGTVESLSMQSSLKQEVTELSAGVRMVTPEILLSGAMLTLALRAPAVQTLTASQMETELFASAGKVMRGIHL